MSEQERIELREKLNKGLEESYEKMLLLKMKLGQDVVIGTLDGTPITLTAEEAWNRYQASKR